MPKTKILYFSHSPYLFGAENCILSLVTSLDRKRFEAVVMLPADGPLKQKLDDAKIKSHIVPMEWWVLNEERFLYPQSDNVQRLDQIMRIVEDERPDIIHSNTSAIWYGAVAARLLGIRHIWHLHEMLLDHPSLRPVFPLSLMYELIGFLSDRVVVVSDELRRELSGYVTSEKLRVVHNGVPPAPVGTDRSFREEMEVGEDRVIAVTVTSLQKYKGIDHLVAAASEVVKHRPEVLFVIAGSGPQEATAALSQKIQELKLEDSIRYVGFRNDVPRLLSAADLFVLPSMKEAFPLVVLEAMSHGKPVIATDSGGVVEMVIDGKTGLVVPVGDSGILAEKIIELTGKRELMLAMGKAAQKRYQLNFTLKNYVANFVSLYAEVLGTSKPALSAKELSLLKASMAAYQQYVTAVRTVSEKTREIEVLTAQTSELRNTDDITRQKQRVDELSSQLRALQEEMGQRWGDIAYRDGRIRQIQEDMARIEAQRTGLEAKLNQKDSELAGLDQRLVQIMEQLACAGEMRTELEQLLDHRSIKLMNRDEKIKLIGQEIVLLEERLLERESQLHEKSGEVTDLKEWIRQIEVEVALERERVAERMRRMDDELALITQQIREKDQRIEDILNSKSWKLTAPLRKTLDLISGKPDKP